ncbi:MAG TPA: asparagine synthase (glutamine-hydrolyzing) [Syntrophus sp. (in: bacteria)]|nr:asparagine synthase (glutamine-hydrolyzing) [Syntrophus sp. (in: bacteria)]
MCGICGILDRSPRGIDLSTLKTMNERAAHRGPDDAGWWACVGGVPHPEPEALPGLAEAGLAHRRLAIIDLSPAGHQPMGSRDGRRWIVFNGEIYNHIELRADLEARGRTFRSRTDTEVVLEALDAWGLDCLGRFNGMWAFAVYDCREGSLLLARDRFGVKPLHYRGGPGRLAFASEIKQLLALPGPAPTLNMERAADFFLYGFSQHTPETFFEGILALPPGHLMTVSRSDLETGRFAPAPFWTPQPAPPLPAPEAVGAFGNLLSDAVRLRLRSDVPVGITLSGGLDSSCVAGFASRILEKERPRAFTVVFDDAGYSERPWVEAVLAHTGMEGTWIRPGASEMGTEWNDFVWHMEEPFRSLSHYSNWRVFRKIREYGVPVVLSGQGGDELLLGYERYRTPALNFELRRGRVPAVAREVLKARRNASMGLLRQAAYWIYFSFPGLRAARRRRMVRPYLRKEFYREYAPRHETLKTAMTWRNRRELQEKEFLRFQLQNLLHHEDRVSMASSIETRLPYLDYRLFEFILGQDLGLLLHDGWSKYILRRAAEGVIPDAVRWRRDKMGYDTPTGRLLSENRAAFLDLFRRHADDPILNSPRLARDFAAGRVDELILCSAVSYLSWRERFGLA